MRSSLQKFLLSGSHAALVIGVLVVVAQEVEEAVHHQVSRLLLYAMTGLLGLALRHRV
jgi:hypothetical protein